MKLRTAKIIRAIFSEANAYMLLGVAALVVIGIVESWLVVLYILGALAGLAAIFALTVGCMRLRGWAVNYIREREREEMQWR